MAVIVYTIHRHFRRRSLRIFHRFFQPVEGFGDGFARGFRGGLQLLAAPFVVDAVDDDEFRADSRRFQAFFERFGVACRHCGVGAAVDEQGWRIVFVHEVDRACLFDHAGRAAIGAAAEES